MANKSPNDLILVTMNRSDYERAVSMINSYQHILDFRRESIRKARETKNPREPIPKPKMEVIAELDSTVSTIEVVKPAIVAPVPLRVIIRPKS